MRNILSDILKIPKVSKTISNDLKRLETVRKGLGTKAINYVTKGTDETVLATLANVDAATALGLKHSFTHPAENQARQFFIARNSTDPALLLRYGRVLAAANGPDTDSLAGSKHVPVHLRMLFTQAGRGLMATSNRWPPVFITASDTTLTPELCLDICAAGEGSLTDLFDMLFHDDGRWARNGQFRGLADIHDFSKLAKSQPEHLIAAGERIGAQGKINLLQKLREWKLLDDPAYPAFTGFTIKMAADSAKSVRSEATQLLGSLRFDLIKDAVADHLNNGNVATRAAMVDAISTTGTPEGYDLLRTHLKGEKTARIKAAIETALTIESTVHAEDSDPADENSYLALDGTRVEIPPLQPLNNDAMPEFGADDLNQLKDGIAKHNAEATRRNKAREEKNHSGREPTFSKGLAKEALDLFNGKSSQEMHKIQPSLRGFLTHGAGKDWTVSALKRLPAKQALPLAYALSGRIGSIFSLYAHGAADAFLVDYVTGHDGDYRHLEKLHATGQQQVYFGTWQNRIARAAVPGDLLRQELARDWSTYEIDDLPKQALWPLVAESFDMLDEAFGLTPSDELRNTRGRAMLFLRLLPKTPQRYFGPLLEIATGTAKTGRASAREMLAGAAGLEGRIISLVDDSRQDVRAGAAEWIADLGMESAIPALKKRLKKEKSDLARAAILTALSKLGVELDDYIGPKALQAEAERVLKRAKFDKIDWLFQSPLPELKYRGGRKVPPEVIKAWLFLANKLKQPGGNKLFDIYMDQLAPEDGAQLSTWIFNSWVNYDTARPSHEEANAYADQHADQRHKSYSRWMKNFTRELAHNQLYNEFRGQYHNSGAASKGLLALSKLTDNADAAAQVRHYLKTHGARTSQASALLELLAAKGDPVSLQIVISAATRLKQKGVQAHAGKLVQAVAEARDWSMDELADRTIPTAGLNDEGILELPCGPEEKPYSARMNDDFKLTLFNPDGKPVKALPAGDDDVTKATKKTLSAARRELKQVATMQGERLYEALCSERSWPVEDWLRDFRNHPLMGLLIDRVIWLGMDENDQLAQAFRPTAEGDFVNAEDDEVDLSQFTTLRLAHGALLQADQVDAWAAHLADYEIKPLFAQFGRPLLSLDTEMQDKISIDDRKGWMTDTFTIRGMASRLGYERGEAMDGGYFNEYFKNFQSAGIRASVEFSGNCLPEENTAAATIYLQFVRLMDNNRVGRPIPLKNVPPVLLSECWNDYRDMASKAVFDPDWEKKMPWM